MGPRANAPIIFLTLLAYFIGQGHVLAKLDPREASSASTLYVPLRLDENQRYIAAVNMSSNPGQHLGFILSTSTGLSAVAGVGCDSCDGAPVYNMTKSTSAKHLPSAGTVQLFNGTAQGPQISEDCALLQANGSTWKYPNQTLLMVEQSSAMFSSTGSGIFGLGTNSQQGNFSDTVIGGFFRRNPNQSQFSFGMALNPPNSDPNDAGMLHWLAPDANSYQGSVSYKEAFSTGGTNSTLSSDWTFQLDSWSFATGDKNITSTNNSMQAIPDPYYVNTYLPLDQARLIYDSVPGAVAQETSTNGTESWTVPCNTDMAFSVTINSQTFTLDQFVLLSSENGVCVGVIQGITTSQYIFGSSLLSAMYLIFTVALSGDASSNSIGFAFRSVNQKASTALIVGATVGSIGVAAFIAIAVILGLHLRRRKRKPARISPMARLYRPTMLFSPSGPGEFAPLMGHDLVAVSPDFHPPYPYAVVSPDPRAHAPSPFHSPSSSVLDIRPPSSAMSIVERNSENLMVNFDRARSPHSIHSATAEGARHQQNSSLQDHDDLTTEEYELPAPPSSSDHHPRNEKRSEQDTSIEPFVLQSPPFNRDRPKKRRVLDPAPVISSSYNAPSPTAVASDAATIAPTLADGSSLAATSPTVRHSTAATRYSSQVSLSATLVTENPIPPGYTRRPPKWG